MPKIELSQKEISIIYSGLNILLRNCGDVIAKNKHKPIKKLIERFKKINL